VWRLAGNHFIVGRRKALDDRGCAWYQIGVSTAGSGQQLVSERREYCRAWANKHHAGRRDCSFCWPLSYTPTLAPLQDGRSMIRHAPPPPLSPYRRLPCSPFSLRELGTPRDRTAQYKRAGHLVRSSLASSITTHSNQPSSSNSPPERRGAPLLLPRVLELDAAWVW
jgi:hypothetical protein